MTHRLTIQAPPPLTFYGLELTNLIENPTASSLDHDMLNLTLDHSWTIT